jgi:hypothetical protein
VEFHQSKISWLLHGSHLSVDGMQMNLLQFVMAVLKAFSAPRISFDSKGAMAD